MTHIKQGTKAVHTIRVETTILTYDLYDTLQGTLSHWEPENGATFKTSGQALRWLKIYLGKPGWPYATNWSIYQHENGIWGVYMQSPPQIHPSFH